MAESVEKNKIRRLQKFVRRLQRLEEGQKKKWLIGLTAVAMLLFIGLWLIYLTTIGLPNIAVKTKTAAPAEIPAQQQEESLWKIFQRGWQEISSQAKENFGKAENLISEQIEKSNEIILNNSTSALTTATTTANATTTQSR